MINIHDLPEEPVASASQEHAERMLREHMEGGGDAFRRNALNGLIDLLPELRTKLEAIAADILAEPLSPSQLEEQQMEAMRLADQGQKAYSAIA